MKHGKLRRSSKVLLIKLSRAIVRRCREHSNSGSFSYSGNVKGRRAIIYCTDDDKSITDRFVGTIKRASTKSSRKWVLVKEAQLLPH